MNQLAITNTPNDNIINQQNITYSIPNLKKDLIDLLNGNFNKIDLMKFISQKGFFISVFNNLEEIKDQDADLYGKLIQIKNQIFTKNFWDGMEMKGKGFFHFNQIDDVKQYDMLKEVITQLQKNNKNNEYNNTYCIVGNLLINLRETYCYAKEHESDQNKIESIKKIHGYIIHLFNNLRTSIGNLSLMVAPGNIGKNLNNKIFQIENYAISFQAINCTTKINTILTNLNSQAKINLFSDIAKDLDQKFNKHNYKNYLICPSQDLLKIMIECVERHIQN